MELWANFYILTGTAAATLVGLMFISIIYGSRLVTPETVHVSRAILSPILYHFAQAFILSCSALLPNKNALALGMAAMVTAVLRLWMLPHLSRHLKKAAAMSNHIETSDWILGLFLPTMLYFVLIVSGAALIMTASWPFLVIALCVLSLLMLGIYSAWDMLIWMTSQVDTSDD